MKRRTNITIHPEIYRKAETLMSIMDFGDFSSFLEHLIRDEYERRQGKISIAAESVHDDHLPPKTLAKNPSSKISYKPTPKNRRAPVALNRRSNLCQPKNI